jgi:1-acyl-sn-glycerol-3-phosphate acyltransferase
MPYTVPLHNRILRAIFIPVFRGLFHLLSQVTIIGQENVPSEGAYIVAYNHISLYDPPVVGTFWPAQLEIIAATDVWDRPIQGLFPWGYGAIPIHRGQYDRHALDLSLAVLESGRPLAIAPEGGRSHVPRLRRAHPGIGYLIAKAGVPVVPVGVAGTTEDFLYRALHLKRPPVEMRIGEPLTFSPDLNRGKDRRAARQKIADDVMYAIAALLPPDYRGVYEDKAARSSTSHRS